MMRLIHDQPVRSPRPHPQLLQPGHQSRKKRGPLRQWQPDEVHHHILLRVLQHPQHLVHARRTLLVSERRRGLKGLIVALRVKDAELILPFHQSLQYAECQVGLPAA